MTPRLSIFLPVFNEEENLPRLYQALIESLEALGESFELIFVDDGSTDRSLELLSAMAENDQRVRVIAFRRNYGQTAAMAAGIDASRGEVLIPMDADLQNDPADMPACSVNSTRDTMSSPAGGATARIPS
jgi:glycosyltransferase involved in cell wall biosynthesis